MRHRIQQRKLNRTSEHRRAMLRNMAQNLIEHGQITTTLAKAKTLRPYVERLVTLALRTRRCTSQSDAAGALRARRRIHRLLGDRGIIAGEHRDEYSGMSDAARAKTMRMASGRRHRTGEPRGRLAFTAESVTHRLIEKVAPQYETRPGGYTRVVRLADRRVGDNSRLAVLQLVGGEEAPLSLTKPAKSARKRRADARYAMAIKAAKSFGGKAKATPPADEKPPVSDADPAGDADADANVEGGDESVA